MRSRRSRLSIAARDHAGISRSSSSKRRAVSVSGRGSSPAIFYNPDQKAVGSGDAGSTHAWAGVYVTGAGWITFDPTNRSVGGFNLIPVPSRATSGRQCRWPAVLSVRPTLFRGFRWRSSSHHRRAKPHMSGHALLHAYFQSVWAAPRQDHLPLPAAPSRLSGLWSRRCRESRRPIRIDAICPVISPSAGAMTMFDSKIVPQIVRDQSSPAGRHICPKACVWFCAACLFLFA